MTGPPGGSIAKTAPSDNRAHPTSEILVRMDNGELAGRVSHQFAEMLSRSGAATSFRGGSRRYLRLRPGIIIRPTLRGWDLIEEERRKHGDDAVRRGLTSLDRRPLKWEPPQNGSKVGK
jgi:hypothetical protein